MDIRKIGIKIPDYVLRVARILLKEGFQAYLVGGAIRDYLVYGEVVLDNVDFDLATDALTEDMLEIFPKAIATGAKFGTVTVISDSKSGERFNVEVTTFREEETYTKGRWPEKVRFVRDIQSDLSRRDFTINAMAINLGEYGVRGISSTQNMWTIVDYFNGLHDLQYEIIRTVGDPVKRFTEDGLRMFRACRLASSLEFRLNDDIFPAIKECLPIARMIAMERIRDEFVKLLMRSPKPSYGIELLRKTGLLEIFLPELLECVSVKQPKFHAFDVYTHLLRMVDIAEDRVKLAALFHDIAKPRCAMPDGHFYGHDIEGEKMVRTIMRRLKFSKREIDRVAILVRNHMFYYPYKYEESGDGAEGSKNFKRWTDAAVRRFIRRVGEENIDDLFALRVADATSNPSSIFDPEEILALQRRISEVRKKDLALKVTDLDINGHDLMKLGLRPSPQMGKILNWLLEKVIEDPKLNRKDKLIELAKQKMWD